MTILRNIVRLAGDAAGTTAIEYAFVASLISIAAVSFMVQMGGSLTTIFTTVAINM
jgi:Flp pilus assembly pilin Flp